MHPTTLLLTTLATLTTATLTTASPTNFYLVTTTTPTHTTNSSHLPNVSALSVYAPTEASETYTLRLIAADYEILPLFNLSNADLVTLQYEPMNEGQALYNSTGVVQEGEELQLAPRREPRGNLGLKGGYLLTVEGEEVGWSVCDGGFGEQVIYWKGNDSSCTSTYIQAVSSPPY
ncbi:hypothetical protein EJ03DRAFT_372823 [Teratosphaeria nubilosa]|uniref:Ubiquitin 3 binding protein But2 C-terminal domain-containing protein n=1 Tax=Teratosphaeria nubilosa TaxID=161662 RepID=A0A6G1LF36_9PEZI|nr:hypothetical protein EJ03DRAFT_372823 [Teratosphaeria nubilosa]